jgi:hypothetical protein
MCTHFVPTLEDAVHNFGNVPQKFSYVESGIFVSLL